MVRTTCLLLVREWSFIPGGGGLEPRRGGSLWSFENKREGRNDKYNPYWGGPSKNVVSYIRYVRIFINLVGFRVMKFQNFLQPWWKRTFLIYAKLDESEGIWSLEFQNFLQPWWREILRNWIILDVLSNGISGSFSAMPWWMRTFQIYAKLDQSGGFQAMKLQKFLQPCWKDISGVCQHSQKDFLNAIN